MMIGPAPITRMDAMSVRLGMGSRGREKVRRHTPEWPGEGGHRQVTGAYMGMPEKCNDKSVGEAGWTRPSRQATPARKRLSNAGRKQDT